MAIDVRADAITPVCVDHPSLALDLNQVAHIAYQMIDPIAPVPYFLKIAHSDGLVPTPTFTTEVAANEPQPVRNVKLEYDPTTGSPRIAFLETGPDPFKTYLLMRSQVLGVWGSNEVVDSALVDIRDLDFQIDTLGTQHLVYEALPGPLGYREVRYARRTEFGTGFEVEVVRASESESRLPVGCSIAVDPATQTPSVAYSFDLSSNTGMLIRAERGSTVDVTTPAGNREMWATVRPNPFRGVGRPTIMLSVGREVLAEGGVFDLKGRRVRVVGPVRCHAGLNEIAFDLDGLKDGVYLVRIRNETTAWGGKVVVMK